MDNKRFHKLEHKEVTELFPSDTPHHGLSHAISEQIYDEGESTAVVYRILVRTDAKAKDAVGYVKDNHYTQALKNDSLRPLLDIGDYGFAIVVPTEERRKQVQKELARAVGDKCSLNRLARFTVRLGPTTNTLHEAIKGLSS